MATVAPPIALDVKIDVNAADKDVEGSAPPSYPLNEPETLVVGHPCTRCHRLRSWFSTRLGYHGCANANGGTCVRTRKCLVVRVIKFLFAAWLLMSLIHLVRVGVKVHKTYKTVKCLPITPSEHLDGLSVTIPTRHTKNIVVHDSLSGGDALITHDPTVAKGTAVVSVTFANVSDQSVYDGCVARIARSTVVGLVPREGEERAKIAMFTVRVPVSKKKLTLKFLGRSPKGLSDRKLQKVIKFWRKHHEKGNSMQAENAVEDTVPCHT